MYEIGIDGLQQLLSEARSAAKYAREHYRDFASRKHTYTLYGPDAYDIGASVPSRIVPSRARKLLKSTRRKDYLVYELDKNYKILRTIHMLDYTKVDCTFHHFELNGVSYAYPFRGSGNGIYNDAIYATKYSSDKPIYYAVVRSNYLFAQFYEYSASDQMIVSTYRYSPNAKYTIHGYPVDHNAPIGALNSPVQRHCTEEVPEYIDFSQWFK